MIISVVTTSLRQDLIWFSDGVDDACLHKFCIFARVAAFSISLVNDKTETVVPALDSMFMKSIVDVAIYKENTLKVSIFLD